MTISRENRILRPTRGRATKTKTTSRIASDILNGSGSDFNDRWNATAAAGEFGPVPRGVYVCHATKGELESSRSKSTPGYKVEFTVIDGDFQGRKLWLDCWLTPAALPQSKRDLAKLGITSPAQMEQPLPKWIRCHVTAVDVLSGKPPTYYPIGEGELSRLEIGPGL